MADQQQNDCRSQEYRYSIPHLIELSLAINCPFDLSKFSYEAARAGVIPSLGDCAMSSRKSSASCTRGTNLDTNSTSDLLIFQGNQVLRPNRQPYLPPPAERQKDEGFAKFLKKHASPTHNRVTAGGRIVPMEPRSPPSISLPSSVMNRPLAQCADQQLKNLLRKTTGDYCNSIADVNHNHCHNDSGSNHILAADRSLNAGLDVGTDRNLEAAQALVMQPSGNQAGSYELHPAMDHFNYSMALPSEDYTVCAPQSINHHMAQQPFQPPQSSTNTYQNAPMVNAGMDVPLADQYNGTAGWPMYHQSFGQQSPTQQMMSPFQLLAGWEQHYVDLDQQLKNIDRHRAMHNLDPRLAQQRRVIVQQRSDAKDTVREYQALLGVRRHVGSSQESWTAGFNIDAPVYVPQCDFNAVKTTNHASLSDAHQSKPVIEKPRGQGQRRAIPIRPPPKDYDAPKSGQQNKPDENHPAKANIKDWMVDSRVSPPRTIRNSSGQSEMAPAEQMRRLDITKGVERISRDRNTRLTSGGGCNYTPETHNYIEDNASYLETLSVCPADSKPPSDIQDEYQRLIRAVSQPKGILTKVRLLDNRVIDVEGQGLGLVSSHEQAGEQTPDVLSNTNMMQGQLSAVSSVDIDDGLMTHPEHFVAETQLANKENICVTPRGHRKAATEAFLAQFNTIDDNVALAARQEIQSLRTASDAHNKTDTSTLPGAGNIHRPGITPSVVNKSFRSAHSLRAEDSGIADMNIPASPDALNHKGYSSIGLQNIHAIGSVPNSYDGALEARQTVQSQLATVNKARSPRFLRRHGGKGGAWYGPYCRDVIERALNQNHSRGPARPYFH